jgi:hypothetical protein
LFYVSSDAEAIPFTFLESRGGKDGIKVTAKPGKTLLEVARDNDIELGKRFFHSFS